MRARGLVAALLALLLLAPAAAAARQNPGNDRVEANATLPDIEDEVMCTICGTSLQLANSPQAERERAFINRLIAQGKTKDEIKDALVAEYGPDVLATPDAEGFDLAVYVLPIAGVLAAILLIGLAARRWRRTAAASPAPASTLDPDDEDRLDDDLRRYDGD
jgi:cytochrome c-type biogenesis protein CcmH/NrfF